VKTVGIRGEAQIYGIKYHRPGAEGFFQRVHRGPQDRLPHPLQSKILLEDALVSAEAQVGSHPEVAYFFEVYPGLQAGDSSGSPKSIGILQIGPASVARHTKGGRVCGEPGAPDSRT